MSIRTVLICRGSTNYHTLDEMVNYKIKTIEDNKGEIIDIQFKDNNKAYIIYKI